ncbi:MAG: helix-turn-helix domain-containing protein [Rikenellaceae bacterium]
MNSYLHKIFTLLVAILLQFSVNATHSIKYEPQLFKHLSVKSGDLSNDDVLCLKQDSRGYLWIGTSDGLNRFNGYSTKIYKNSQDNQLFASNKINSIEEDSEGRLWIGTSEGVSVYDFEKDTFLCLIDQPFASKILEQTGIVDIIEHRANNQMMCLTLSGGMLVYDMELRVKKFKPIAQSKLFSIKKLSQSEYIIVSRADIKLYNAEVGDEREIFNSKGSVIKSFYKDKNRIYIAVDSSIYSADYSVVDNRVSVGQFYEYHRFNHKINCINIDSLGGIWCGVNRYGFVYLSANNSQNESNLLSIRKISDIKNLKSGDVVVSTSDSGVYLYSTNPYKIGEIKLDKNEGSAIWRTSKLDDKRIFITHESDNPYAIFNTETRKLEQSHRLLTNLQSKQRFFVNNDNFLAGMIDYSGGRITLRRFESGAVETIMQYGDDNTKFDKYKAGYCVEDYLNRVWIPSVDALHRLYIKKDNRGKMFFTVERISLPNFSNKELSINDIKFDTVNNRAWLSSPDLGIYRIDNCHNEVISTDDIYHYNVNSPESALIAESVWSIVVCDSLLWIATEDKGLCKAIVKDRDIQFLNVDNAPKSSVRSMLKDNEDNLWIGSAGGLIYFNTKNYTSKTFTQADGVAFRDFSSGVLMVDDSLFVMQSESKLVLINSNLLKNRELPQRVQFEDLTVMNQKIVPLKKYNDKIVVNSSISDGDTIFLTRKMNTFSLNALPISSSMRDDGYVRYRLLPSDREWQVQSGKNCTIAFADLAQGSYTLEVSAANNSKQWGLAQQLFIEVSSSFWLSKIAWFLYFVLFIAMLYIMLRVQMNRKSAIIVSSENIPIISDLNQFNSLSKIVVTAEQQEQSTSFEENQFMKDFYKLVEQNFDNEELDLNLMAKKLLLNRTHFFQKIKQITNKTPYELIKEYRLEKAAEMLRNGEKSIDAICVQTGFKGRSHFSRLFKEKYGVPPSQYAKSVNQHKHS